MLISLEIIKIPRWTGVILIQQWEIHGFADASKRAYAAVAYAVLPGYKLTMLVSKSKVALTKVLTLPQLELSGTLLLSRLVAHLVSNIP